MGSTIVDILSFKNQGNSTGIRCQEFFGDKIGQQLKNGCPSPVCRQAGLLSALFYFFFPVLIITNKDINPNIARQTHNYRH
jgi:hypothetical protein